MALEDAKTQVDQAFSRQDLRGLSFENAFGGAVSFLRRRYSKDLSGVDIAVTGVPFDQAVTHRTGTRFGPRAIREASCLQPYDPPYGWGYDPLGEFAVVDYGDVAFDYAKVADFPATLQAHAAKVLAAGSAMITLGGDHFITLPILKAHAEKYGRFQWSSSTHILTCGKMMISTGSTTGHSCIRLSSWVSLTQRPLCKWVFARSAQITWV